VSDEVQVIEIAPGSEPTVVYVPGHSSSGADPALAALVHELDGRVTVLEAGAGDPDAVQTLVDASLTVHVQALTPHPAYDTDIPSLSILFENGLV
jgi:hypothetical protein